MIKNNVNNNSNRTTRCLVIGGTGLVGKRLVQLLDQDDRVSHICCLGRREGTVNSKKIKYVINSMTHIDDHTLFKTSDVIFCTLGTTIKKAGSKEQFRAIDYDMTMRVARLAKKYHVNTCIVVTSLGAHPKSSLFYSRVKGDLEEALKKLEFNYLGIIRPSLLLGPRSERRFAEWIGQKVMSYFSWMFQGSFKKYRATSHENVAKMCFKLGITMPHEIHDDALDVEIVDTRDLTI